MGMNRTSTILGKHVTNKATCKLDEQRTIIYIRLYEHSIVECPESSSRRKKIGKPSEINKTQDKLNSKQ